jgi:hypothetical protein
MEIKAHMVFKYHTAHQAKIAQKALEVDNKDFIDSYNDNKCLICNLNGDSVRTILATSDDLLFCEMMVEKILELVK